MKFYILCILAVAFSFSCSKRSGIKTKCESPCESNRACTEEFRSIVVEISGQSGSAIELDSIAVVRKSDNKTIVIDQQAIIPKIGRYILFSDSHINETSRCGEDFEFRGYKDKQPVVSRIFNIAHNCCHISLASGDTKIVI